LNGGNMDGFLASGDNDDYSIGYYVEADRPFFNELARNYTTCDRFFASILAETFPNRIFQHAAQTDRLENTVDGSELPTIWDRLAERGVSARYYFSDVPSGALDRRADWPRTTSSRRCQRRQASPRGLHRSALRRRDDGDVGDDHPHADIRAGDARAHVPCGGVQPELAADGVHRHVRRVGGFFEHGAAARPRPTPSIPTSDGKTPSVSACRRHRVAVHARKPGQPANRFGYSTHVDPEAHQWR
jgi:phospholipase C